LLVALVGILMVVGVGGWLVFGRQGKTQPQKIQEVAKTEKLLVTVELALTNLEPLAKGHFEAWLTKGGKRQSLGLFNVNKDERLLDLSGREIAGNRFQLKNDFGDIEGLEITIEPDGDRNSAPSPTLILKGNFVNSTANLAFEAIDPTDISGQYVLATPTNDPVGQEESGVWFFLPPGGNDSKMRPSLLLPKAPKGWKYEGWVVHQGKTLSTGRFSEVSGPDQSAAYSGRLGGPPFPGEDFLTNKPKNLDFPFPINLADGASRVIVSIEPDIDDQDPTGGNPFQLQLLSAVIGENVKARQPLDLILDTATTFPKGTAKILTT